MPNPKADALIRRWGQRFRAAPLAAGVVADLKERDKKMMNRRRVAMLGETAAQLLGIKA